MTEWVNNHKVTCSECLYSRVHEMWLDGVPFTINVTCSLGYETDYRVPYAEYWDCEYFEKWTLFKSIKRKIKQLIKKVI